MKIDLVNIPKSVENLSCDERIELLYVDFNVVNILYEQKLQIPAHFYLYYDSFLIRAVIKLLGYKNIKRQVSTDFQYRLLNRINKSNKRVFFFGDSKEVLNGVEDQVNKNYSNIEIVGGIEGYRYNSDEVVEIINQSKPDILFVGLGAGRQEKWIIENYNKIEAKVILSVGGWFQFLAGQKKRAPKFLRNLNLEWLYKLAAEFLRVWKRYFVGAPLFLYRVLVSKEIELRLNEKQ